MGQMEYQEMKTDLLERLHAFLAWMMEKPSTFDTEQFALLPVLLRLFFEYKSPGTPSASPEVTN